MRRFLLLFVTPTTALILLSVLPLVLGEETLYLRDVLNAHLQLKASEAEALREGYVPLIDPYRAGGQALLGNPNAVPLYPSNLLFLVAPTLWAFNAHFWLHLLVAPFSFFYLARAWGLERRAAWGAGLCFALSGYFFSQLNFFNLVAGVALAPAFAGACLKASETHSGTPSRRLSWTVVGVAVLWGLILLSGDPMIMLQAFGLGVSGVLFRLGVPRSVERWRSVAPAFLRVGVALVCGSLLAAPQLVEFARTVPLSYRVYWGFSYEWSLGASWDPRTAFEWLLPFAFGRPEFRFWGSKLFLGTVPLYFTLYPGLLALALLLASGRPRHRAAWWGWLWIAIGLLLALGYWNPLVRMLVGAGAAQILRFPVKFWLLVAVGWSLLCGIALERLTSRAPAPALRRALLVLALLLATVWTATNVLPDAVDGLLRSLMPEQVSQGFVEEERRRWAAMSLGSLGIVAGMGLLLWLRRRSGEVALAGLLLLHTATQLWLMRPAVPTDRSWFYRQPPPLLESLGEDELIVNAEYSELFGSRPGPRPSPPDERIVWLERAGIDTFYPFLGPLWGRRFALNVSPEGLDSFLTFAVADAVKIHSDEERLRILSALGVDVLILGRPLDAAALEQVRLRRRLATMGRLVYLYELRETAAPVQLVTSVRRAPHMNAAVELLKSADFDPRSMVVIPGSGPDTDGPRGSAEILEESRERLTVRVRSAGEGILLVRRTFLPFYRATLDGETVAPVAANVCRLGIRVPPGEHVVHLWVDRRPFRFSLLGIPLAVVGLLLVVRGSLRWGRDPAECAPSTAVEADANDAGPSS